MANGNGNGNGGGFWSGFWDILGDIGGTAVDVLSDVPPDIWGSIFGGGRAGGGGATGEYLPTSTGSGLGNGTGPGPVMGTEVGHPAMGRMRGCHYYTVSQPGGAVANVRGVWRERKRMVGTGQFYIGKCRRMNPLNPRALARAGRRVEAASRAIRRVKILRKFWGGASPGARRSGSGAAARCCPPFARRRK